MNTVRTLISKFTSLYKGRYAVVTNTVTAGCMGAVCDIVTQKIERNEYDVQRTQRMAILGTTCAPLMHYWYRYLDGKFTPNMKHAILKKVALDVLISPIWYGIYLGVFCILKRYTWEETVTDLKGKLPILISFDLVSWPLFQAVNFSLLPPHFRVVGVKINEFCLGIVSSHLLNNPYDIRELFDKYFKK
ncbi:mpv17-like protein 2 [Ciona intestinalis]